MNKCGECVLGVRQGAVCENCKGTTFVEDQVQTETTVQKVKRVVKKAVSKKK